MAHRRSESRDCAAEQLARELEAALGAGAVLEHEPLSRHTTLRVGGPADLLVVADNSETLCQVVLQAWECGVPCRVLGMGANVLVSDAGIEGMVVVNRSRDVRFLPWGVRAASGAALAAVARESIARGLDGLEWAVGIPGSVGGAVVGNAGAWGGEIAAVLKAARVLEPGGEVAEWPVERFEYSYRSSCLKGRHAAPAQRPVVLDADFVLAPGDRERLQARVAEIESRRAATQPAGSSCGSVFRNPPGDSSGRLIEAAGLKGRAHGGAQISTVHANFILNRGSATAADVKALIDLASSAVREQFGVDLELEIELLGEWQPQIRVGILFGGRSGEHEVSLMSAASVMGAIDRAKYLVVPIGITKEGRWLASGDPMKALTTGVAGAERPAALLAEPSHSGLIALGAPNQEAHSAPAALGTLDVVFPALHGPLGEDGAIQGLLELADLPYVGAGVAASAVGMDKVLFKRIMTAHGLPVVPYVVLLRKEWENDPERCLERVEGEIGYSCFVKPANLGSSVGISKAHNRPELAIALEEAARYDRKLVVEVAVDAREIEVSVLGNDAPIASVPGEIVPCNEFYDYAAKYLDGESELRIPAPIPLETADKARRMAIEAFRAIDGCGMARADFLLDRKTGELYVNELNTLPGFTPISMYPKLWEASGISYRELIDRLIELALERHADKSRSATSYQAPRKRE